MQYSQARLANKQVIANNHVNPDQIGTSLESNWAIGNPAQLNHAWQEWALRTVLIHFLQSTAQDKI